MGILKNNTGYEIKVFTLKIMIKTLIWSITIKERIKLNFAFKFFNFLNSF